ncbi:hypothetical protein OAM34_05530 [Alphaproteobacteria bacterium]|nr:hypothetical protein [Alphaproteobacteria bacterium]
MAGVINSAYAQISEDNLTPKYILSIENELSELLATGDFKKAWRLTQDTLFPYHSSPTLTVLYIESAINSNHYIQAEEIARQALMIYPKYPIFSYYLVKLAYEVNHCNSALRIIRQADKIILTKQIADYFLFVSQSCSPKWRTQLFTEIGLENGLFGQASPNNLVEISQGSSIDNLCQIYASSCQEQDAELSFVTSRKQNYITNRDLITQQKRVTNNYIASRAFAFQFRVPVSGGQSITSLHLQSGFQSARYGHGGWGVSSFLFFEKAENIYSDNSLESAVVGLKFHQKQKKSLLGQTDYSVNYFAQNPEGNAVIYHKVKAAHSIWINSNFKFKGYFKEHQRMPQLQTDFYGPSSSSIAGIQATLGLNKGHRVIVDFSSGKQKFKQSLPYLNAPHFVQHTNHRIKYSLPLQLLKLAKYMPKKQILWIVFNDENRSSLDLIQNFSEQTYSIGFNTKF